MALVEATVKQTIITELDAVYGPPADPAVQEKLATALAKAVITILTTQLTTTTTIGVGSSAGVYPGVNT